MDHGYVLDIKLSLCFQYSEITCQFDKGGISILRESFLFFLSIVVWPDGRSFCTSVYSIGLKLFWNILHLTLHKNRSLRNLMVWKERH